MPTEVFAEVKPLVGKSVDEIIEQVYLKPKANRYCAQFCKWVEMTGTRIPITTTSC